MALAILWIEAVCTGADGRAHYEIMAPDLSEEEKIALVDLLKRTVEADHYPLSLRVLEGAARIPAAATPPSVISGPGLDFTRGDASRGSPSKSECRGDSGKRSPSLRGVLAKSGSVWPPRPFVCETRRHWSDRVVQNSILLFLDPFLPLRQLAIPVGD